MWKALSKAKLVFPTSDSSLNDREPIWDACEYSKCGRTDKGVSAFGQVISLRVRSNRPVSTAKREHIPEETDAGNEEYKNTPDADIAPSQAPPFDPIKDEIPYPQILNRLLPPEIRILAWCPFPSASFSARFSCTERCYKYFFTQPAFAPIPAPLEFLDAQNPHKQRNEGWLDTGAMSEAAQKFKGSHDFRNFCKVDPSKQIDNFRRLINHAKIVRVTPKRNGPPGHSELASFHERRPPGMDPLEPAQVYAFEVQGSGFLWHQVRHMVAILFLIGQGLEKPCLVDDLLDIEKTPRKPVYDMADAAPLVLEDCKFSPELQWVYLGDDTGSGVGVAKNGLKGDGKYGIGGAVDELWKVWRKHKIDETLAASLLDLTIRGQGDASTGPREAGPRRLQTDTALKIEKKTSDSQRVFLGGDSPRHVGQYTPVLKRHRMETVDQINSKYLKRKGLDPPALDEDEIADAADEG